MRIRPLHLSDDTLDLDLGCLIEHRERVMRCGRERKQRTQGNRGKTSVDGGHFFGSLIPHWLGRV
jgi:hypothetical protein